MSRKPKPANDHPEYRRGYSAGYLAGKKSQQQSLDKMASNLRYVMSLRTKEARKASEVPHE